MIALSLALPGLFFFGRALALRLTRDRYTGNVLAPGLGLACFVLTTHVAAKLTQSYQWGLALTLFLLGGLGYAWACPVRGERAPLKLHKPPSRWMWAFALVTTALMTPIAVRWAFHDEISVLGHSATVAAMQNHYPPRNLSLPQYELNYHYGFEIVATALTALFRLSIAASLDATTLVLWFYSIVVFWSLGERVVGTGYGGVAAILTLLGAGSPYLCSESMAQSLPLAGHLLSHCRVGDMTLNPPMPSYFFQRPWSLGVPLAGVLLLIQADDNASSRVLRTALLALLSCALYLSQVVLFCTVVASILASEILDRRRIRLSARLVTTTVLALVAGAAPFALGGFFGKDPDGGGHSLLWHPGVSDTPWRSARWLVQNYGVLLLGLVGLVWLQKRRVLFGALAVGSLLVLNVFRYELSWDIAKFATTGTLALGVLTAALLRRLCVSSFALLRNVAPAAILLAAAAASIGFCLTLALELPGIPSMYTQVSVPMARDDRRAAAFLRTHMPRDAIMYRRRPEFRGYASHAGLPQVWIENVLPALKSVTERRTRLAMTWPSEAQPYLEQGVRYFVLDASDRRLREVTDAWQMSGLARERGHFGALRIVELLKAPEAAELRGYANARTSTRRQGSPAIRELEL